MAASVLRHIARSAFCTESEIAMFSAYFDASGDDRQRVVTVAGFVSRLHKWERLSIAWGKLLHEANPNVTMFHMTDFVSSRRGWESWRGKSEKRAKLISDLVSCIRDHTNKGFANSIQTEDYRLANDEYQLREGLGPPYAIAAMVCLGALKKWAANKRTDYKRILIVFEDGDEHQGELLSRARSEGFNAIPQSKQLIRAFDACDLAAWKAKSIIDDSYARMLWQEDPQSADRILAALAQLEKIVQTDANTRLSHERLIRVCEGLPVPIARRASRAIIKS